MQTRKSIVFIFIVGLFLKYFNSEAQESQMKFGAYLDTYYAYDFSQPNGNSRPYVTQYARHNEFTINHAWLRGSYSSEKLRANLALQTGTYPQYNYAAEPLYGQLIYEAFAGYRITEKGWIDAGIFGGHFGYESALAIDRELLSPALATEYTPYYQTGVRYTQDLSEKTQLRVVIVNGWQNIRETNNAKSIGMAIDHQFSEQFFFSYGNYYGFEPNESGSDVARFHNNLVARFTPSDQLAITGIFDWTLQTKSVSVTGESPNDWATFYTLIGGYQLSDVWSISGRYEYVTDNNELLINGAGNGFGQSIISTALDFRPAENVSFKIEPKFYAGPSDYLVGTTSAFVMQGGLAFRLE